MLKTMQDWHNSPLHDFSDFCQAGDEIDQEIYYYFLEVLPPATMKGGMFQVGEPYNHVDGFPTYGTFYETKGGKYYYWGHLTTREALQKLQENN